MIKTLVMIRHAHRSKKLGRDLDNGLSDKGIKQAERLGSFYASRFGEVRALLLSSPKRRCIETLEPIARETSSKIREWKCLDEEGDIPHKIETFLTDWEKHHDPLTLLCSHGDWIPEFFQRELKIAVDLEKGAWAELEKSANGWRLNWLIQDFKNV